MDKEYKPSEFTERVKELMDNEGFDFGEAVKQAMREEQSREKYADAGMVDPKSIDPKKIKQAQQMIKMGADVSTISSITELSEEQIKKLMKEKEKLAKGGRPGYARGMGPEDIPEQEEIPIDEYQDLLKSLGAGREQEAGIRSLEGSKVASAPDIMAEKNNLSLELFNKPLFDLTPRELEMLNDYIESKVRAPKAPSIKIAKADDDLLSEYDKYVYDMLEQGLEPISFRQFRDQILAEARLGVQAGGITSVM